MSNRSLILTPFIKSNLMFLSRVRNWISFLKEWWGGAREQTGREDTVIGVCFPISDSVPWNKPNSLGSQFTQCPPWQSSLSLESQDSGCSGNYIVIRGCYQDHQCPYASWCQGILEGSWRALGTPSDHEVLSWEAVPLQWRSASVFTSLSVGFHIGKVWVSKGSIMPRL